MERRLARLELEVNPITLARKLGYTPVPDPTQKKYVEMKKKILDGTVDVVRIVIEQDGAPRFLFADGRNVGPRHIAFWATGGTPKTVRTFLRESLEAVSPTDKALLPLKCEKERLEAFKLFSANGKSGLDAQGWLADHSLREDTVRDNRFKGQWSDWKSPGLAFLYRDRFGLAGIDMVDGQQTISAGLPGIWKTNNTHTAGRLVIVSHPIEAMSHAQLDGDARTAYACASGAMWTADQLRDLSQLAAMVAARGGVVVNAVTLNREQWSTVNQFIMSDIPEENRQCQAPDALKSWNEQAARACSVERTPSRSVETAPQEWGLSM